MIKHTHIDSHRLVGVHEGEDIVFRDVRFLQIEKLGHFFEHLIVK